MLAIKDAVFNYFAELPAEIYASLIIMAIICIFSVIVGHKVKKADPFKRPSTIVLIGYTIVDGVSNFVKNNMGKKLLYFAPYLCVIIMYLPMCMIAGLIGLPSPIAYWGVPLCLALGSFVMIHFTAIKYNGVKSWSHRFIEPFPVFLPINIVTLPSTVISLSFRLFGNALAGSIIMTLIYWVTGSMSTGLAGLLGFVNVPVIGEFNYIGPFLAPLFHAYFDAFGAFIQTLVFMMLTALFVAQEMPEEE